MLVHREDIGFTVSEEPNDVIAILLSMSIENAENDQADDARVEFLLELGNSVLRF